MTATHSRVIGKDARKANEGSSWAKTRTRKDKSRDGSRDRLTSQIEHAIRKRDWTRARSLLQDELISEPTDHWLWFTLSLTFYEQRAYEKALKCSQRAVELCPNCPLALWHYAGSLQVCGRESSAIVIWTMLLAMDVDEVAYGEHGEGMDRALQLLNDVQYRLGRHFQQAGNREQARLHFEKYLHNREHGVGSLYKARTAQACLSESKSI